MKSIVCICAAALLPVCAEQQVKEERNIELRVTGPGPGAQGDVLFQALPGIPPAVGAQGVAFGGSTFEFITTEIAGPFQAVKNAPYAADITTESVQMLSDGNRITHKNSQSFYRDSEGRTRREMNAGLPGNSAESRQLVFIDDPVAQVHYVLNANEKTARKLPMAKLEAGMARVTARASATAMAHAQGETMTFTHKLSGSPDSVSTQDLGTQTMEGIAVKGTKTTLTIPAGEMGNERPIVTSTESWYSDELKTAVFSKRSDPRFGDATTRTTNVRRGEQPRYLFEVPADYKVVDTPATIRVEKRSNEL